MKKNTNDNVHCSRFIEFSGEKKIMQKNDNNKSSRRKKRKTFHCKIKKGNL